MDGLFLFLFRLLSHQCIVLGGFIILAWSLLFVAKIVFHPLRDIPGPLWARFSRVWYLRTVNKGHFEKRNIALHRAHGANTAFSIILKPVFAAYAYFISVGPIVRIAPGQYSLDDAGAVRIIYSPSSSFIKAPWYSASSNPNPESHDLFTDRDSRRHSANRRKVASLYSMTRLVQMESCVTECTALLMERLTRFCVSGEPFNLQRWMQYYAFDVIGLITVNKRFGFLDNATDQNSLIASLHYYLVYAANVGIYAEWHPIIARIMAFLPASGIKHLQSFTAQQISEGKKNFLKTQKPQSSSESFLQTLIRLNTQNPDKFSLADIFTTCITNIGAGSDTTSISLTAILYNLLKHPNVYQKLHEEIKQADNQGKLSSPAISFRESQSLPYFQACVKEGLRLHPATGLPLSRVVPKGGATLCGRFFPQGEIVGVNAWVIHRNKSIYGMDADFYRPERWIESPERSSEMERNFLARGRQFGAGARTCIGKNISLMEIGKLIPELIRRFDFELVDEGVPLDTQNVWFVKQTNIQCRVRLRGKGKNPSNDRGC
ncbi:uncharacterized protein N7496_004619 [Penicillium cataractarum]|uniref:Pisatin demethylase n=1 Tax=Penicillium cataractarum TaxID=2100454 RepID=A0A9W9SF09_9EURO|nr:uncharacterized protein N7496_004619 [Penicillium cataractarum]KAJ5377210.1 hypothetical protein N7496_004619 [Penicillium cataractarum]